MERLKHYLRWRNINIFLATLVVIALGAVLGPIALSGPRVLESAPADGVRDANPQAGIRIVFNQWVQPDSVRGAVRFDPPVDFTVDAPSFPRAGATLVTIKPQNGLRYGVAYRMTLANSVQNMFGRRLDQPLAIAFATVPYVTVAKFGPEQDAKDVALGAPILVEFGAPVVPAATVAAAADDPRIADTLPQPLALKPETPGVGRWLSPTLFGFYPNERLHSATTYIASVPTNVTADGKMRLEQPVAWSFTTAAPLLAGTRPFDGATDVPAAGAVEVRLEPDVDVDAAGRSFSLREAGSGATVQGTLQASAGGFMFKPVAPLERGARYEASLAPGVTSRSGAKLNASPLNWSFSVIGDLAVAQVEPLADTTEVITGTRRISVRFNHPVVAFTTADDQKKLPQPLAIDPPVAGEGRWLDTSTYIFTPKAGLAGSTTYRVRVAAGLQDQTGGALKQEYSWSFTTIMPKIYGSDPEGGAQYAGPRDPIQIIFNQAIDLASARGAIALRHDGADIPGTLGYGGTKPNALTLYSKENGQPTASFDGYVVNFRPAAALERGASYTLSVAPGIRSAEGSGTLADGYTATFQVAPLPRMLRSTPADGATGVTQSTPVALTFSAPMDWGTVDQNLTIEPKPTEMYTSTNVVDFTPYFTYQPDTDYRITIGGAARDKYGVPLGADTTISFHTAPLPPSLALVGAYRFGAYNAYVPARVPVQHVATPSVSYKLYSVEPTAGLTLLNDYDAWNNYTPSAAPVKQADVSLPGDRNQQRLDLLDLGRLDAGMYYLEVRGPEAAFDRQLMVVSPYALTLKRSADQIFVWVVDLASGQPVRDLPLGGASYDYNIRQAAPMELGGTDADGVLQHAIASHDPSAPLMVWSLDSKRFALGSTTWSEGVNPWDFGMPADYGNSPLVGSVYTDRPIYRPEQNVYIRGALRLDNHKLSYDLPPKDQQAFVQINDPEGNTIYSTTLALSEFGTFNTSIALERSAKLGTYSLFGQLYANGQAVENGGNFYSTFNVAEYRKPAFDVSVTPTKADLTQGDTLEMAVEAKYFSGGALANAPVRWRLLRNPLAFAPDSAANFSFNDVDDASAWYRGDTPVAPGGELVADGQATTDAQGKLVIKQPATIDKDGHSQTLTLDVEVTDVDGQVIASEGEVRVHAGAFYVGLRPENYVVQAGQQQTISILTLDPQEQPAANRKLSLSLYKREWNSVRQQGADGQLYWTSHYSDTLVETKDAATDANGRGSVAFTLKDGGEYHIRAEARDDAGHTIVSGAYTWAYGGDVFWGIDDTNRIDLIADKSSYKPGDTASILVTAPYKGMSALMTIERGSVIEHKLLTLNGTTELLKVPLKAEYAPNIYVSVVLIKPAGGDVPVPDLRVGLVNLPISTEQQELKIDVTPDSTAAGPRDQLTYNIKATDYAGKGVRAEIGLALVDKAVLSLADDPNPTFKQAFYTKRPLAVFTAPSLTALVDRVTLKLQPGDKGGGGGAAAEVLVRRNFPDTAYWNPSVTTADDGTAKVTLTLPDSLTTWTMTARGLTADTRVGQVTTDLLSTKALLVRPSLPRFLTVGDKLTLQAVVQNNTANPIDGTVTLDTGTQGGGRVKLNGDAKQTVSVPANSSAVVRWPAEVPAAGQATLRFTVEGGNMQDSVEQALTIQRYVTPEVMATAGQVLDTTVETIAAPAAQSTSGTPQGELDLELEPSLAAGVDSTLGYLEQYPYFCSEQTVSRFLPNAVTYRLLGALRDPAHQAQLKTALDRNLVAGLQRLYALQHLDGGWGWWENDDSQPYLTAYVVQGLVEAKKAGYAVDPTRFDQAIAYLKSALDTQKSSTPDAQFSVLNARSYILFVLAEAGQADRGRTVALYDQRQRLDIYGRAYLLMSLKTLGGSDERVKTLVGELMSTAIMHTTDAHWEEQRVDYWNMSSDTRTTALALQALVRADPTNYLVPNAVRYLMGQRDHGHWQTTQESAVSLMALSEYIAQSGELDADYTYRASLDGKTLKESTANRDNLAEPISIITSLADLKLGGQSQVTIQRQAASGQTGKGRLYYTLRMRYYQDAASVAALDQGVGVQREYIAVDTDTLSPTGQLISQAKLSDVVQVRLTLTVPEDMQYFAVEDMLPAGLEALDASLKTTSAAARDARLESTDGSTPYWWYFNQTSIHDNRVALFATHLPKGTYEYTYLARATNAGTFQALPATAYQMYAPEVFGRSAGAAFTVTGQ